MYGCDVHVPEFVVNVAQNNILRVYFPQHILEPQMDSTGNSYSKSVTCTYTYLTYLLTDITLTLKKLWSQTFEGWAPLID